MAYNNLITLCRCPWSDGYEWQGIFSRIVPTAAKWAQVVEPRLDAFVGLGVPYLSEWLKYRETTLAPIFKALGNKRIIILVDDLDRADFRLVPGILYSLHKLLDIPGFSFVLGFDPEKVAISLGRAGFTDDPQFLEKIVDFPRRLPEPSAEQLEGLVRSEVLKWCGFVDVDALQAIYTHLPSNPRVLKHFIRQVWCLKSEVERYKQDEIDWPLLLLITMLRTRWPRLGKEMFSSKEELTRIASTSPVWTSSGQDRDVAVKAHEQLLDELFKRAGVHEHDRIAAAPLIKALLERAMYSLKSDVYALAQILSNPAILTRRELEGVIKEAEAPIDVSGLGRKLQTHAGQRQVDYRTICQTAFQLLLESYDGFLSRCADADDELGMRELLDKAEHTLALIRTLAIDLCGLTGRPPHLHAKHFHQLLNLFAKWAVNAG